MARWLDDRHEAIEMERLEASLDDVGGFPMSDASKFYNLLQRLRLRLRLRLRMKRSANCEQSLDWKAADAIDRHQA